MKQLYSPTLRPHSLTRNLTGQPVPPPPSRHAVTPPGRARSPDGRYAAQRGPEGAAQLLHRAPAPPCVYQGGFGIASIDKVADALLLLGLHQPRRQQPLLATGSPGGAGKSPAHAAHSPAAGTTAPAHPVGGKEGRTGCGAATGNPLSGRGLSDSGMR